MYLWKTAPLVDALKNNTLQESEYKNYYLLTAIMICCVLYLDASSATDNWIADAVETLLTIIITFFGLNMAFKANRGDAGSGYLNKVTSLSVPLMVKAIVAALILTIPLVVLNLGEGMDDAQVEWALVVLGTLIQLVFYWRLITHVRATNA